MNGTSSTTATATRTMTTLFENGLPLTLIERDTNPKETKEFYSFGGKENRETDFVYPSSLKWTISPRGLMPLAYDRHLSYLPAYDQNLPPHFPQHHHGMMYPTLPPAAI